MVVGAGQREATRMGEDVVILLEEDIEEWAIRVGHESAQAQHGDVVAR